MVSFAAQPLVADDCTEFNGGFYIPHRGRQTARGANGRFYTVYAFNSGSAATIRCVCWEANALGAITMHWNFKVGDNGFGVGTSDTEAPQSFQVAIDNNGSVERVIVAWADPSAGSTGQIKFAYTNTASPAAFTAGDSFNIKDAAFTVSIGMELFGRNGTNEIVIVYGNADSADLGTSNAKVLSRVLTSHSGTWSSAVDVFDPSTAAITGVIWNGDMHFACSRMTTGQFRGILTIGVGAVLSQTWGVWQIFRASAPGSGWGAPTFGIAVDGANHYALSCAADLAGDLHHVFARRLGSTMSLVYMKATSATTGAGAVLEQSVIDTVGWANTYPTAFGFFRSASITVDQDGNPHVIAMRRAASVGDGTTPSGGFVEGQTFYYRRNGSTWERYLVTNRRDVQGAITFPAVRTVNSQSMPHDVCVVGKMGAPARGAMWVELACHNPTQGATFDICNAPGTQRRIVMTDDWEPGLTRRGRNSMLGAQANTTAGPKYVFPMNLLGLAQAISKIGSLFPRTGANALAVNGSASGGKGKSGANTLSLSEVVTAIADYLSKWTGRNFLDVSGAATQNKVIHRLAQNFIVLLDAIAKFGAGANSIEFSQSVTIGGDIRVEAGNEVEFDDAAVFDPIEGCETNYQTARPIPSDPDSHIFTSLTAPASLPMKTIVLRRPELGDEDTLAMQGEISRAQSGAVRSAIRTPNPISWTATFTGLTRKQVIEFEDFFEEWRGNAMIYRDHNNWTWRVYVLTTKPTFQSQGPENWFVTLEFTGTLIGG